MPPCPLQEDEQGFCLSQNAYDGSDHYYDPMGKTMTATAAKANFLRLLDEAAAGEEIEITRYGHPVARLIPPAGAGSLKASFKGRAMTAGKEEELFSTGETWEAS